MTRFTSFQTKIFLVVVGVALVPLIFSIIFGSGVTLLLVFILTAAAGLTVTFQVTAPLTELVHAVEQIAQGDLTTELVTEREDEVGRLAATFSRLTADLNLRTQNEAEAVESLNATVDDYTRFVDGITDGKLSERLPVNGQRDKLTHLGHNLNSMAESVSSLVGKVQSAGTNIATTSTEIHAATSQHNAGSSEQALSISQTTATVDEVRQTAEENTDRAQTVADAAQRSVEISETGLEAVERTVSGMESIKVKVEQIAMNIKALSEQTEQIGNIISTVNDIAEQSNLLALNASIEAARAGEQGKGFAVVATEVRNLAEQSQQATAQVREILSATQKAIKSVAAATDEGTIGVEGGMALAQQSGVTIQTLATAINEAAVSAQQIVASANQQSAGMDQIAGSMADINQAMTDSRASNKQTESAVASLTELGEGLNEVVSMFLLSDPEVI